MTKQVQERIFPFEVSAKFIEILPTEAATTKQ